MRNRICWLASPEAIYAERKMRSFLDLFFFIFFEKARIQFLSPQSKRGVEEDHTAYFGASQTKIQPPPGNSASNPKSYATTLVFIWIGIKFFTFLDCLQRGSSPRGCSLYTEPIISIQYTISMSKY